MYLYKSIINHIYGIVNTYMTVYIGSYDHFGTSISKCVELKLYYLLPTIRVATGMVSLRRERNVYELGEPSQKRLTLTQTETNTLHPLFMIDTKHRQIKV